MKILITAGPTREYLDDVRYLSNASSGKMGYALAEAAISRGHEVVLISGPVEMHPPANCEFHFVETTSQMLEASLERFAECDGVIAAAAVCDYKPKERIVGKIAKTGDPISIEMIETDDVLAELGKRKEKQWIIGFALEATNPRENALQKLRAKNCDYVIVNSPRVIGSDTTSMELIDPNGKVCMECTGTKTDVARQIIDWISTTF